MRHFKKAGKLAKTRTAAGQDRRSKRMKGDKTGGAARDGGAGQAAEGMAEGERGEAGGGAACPSRRRRRYTAMSPGGPAADRGRPAQAADGDLWGVHLLLPVQSGTQGAQPDQRVSGDRVLHQRRRADLSAAPGETGHWRRGLHRGRPLQLDACRCLGCCGMAPVMMVNEDVYGSLTGDELDAILAKYE